MKSSLVFGCIALFSSAWGATMDLSGEWGNYENRGTYETEKLSGARCIIQLIRERRYVFLAGWTTPVVMHTVIDHQRWIARSSENCTLPGKKPENAYITTRMWDVDVDRPPDGGVFKISAKFKSCVGTDCDNVLTYKENFTATLSIDSDKLVDSGDDLNVGRVEYVRIEDLKRRSYAAVAATLNRLRDLTLDDEGKFVDEMVDPDIVQAQGRQNVVNRLNQYYVESLQGGSSFEVVESYLMPEKTSPVAVPPQVYATVIHRPLNGVGQGEYIELSYKDGAWRFTAALFL